MNLDGKEQLALLKKGQLTELADSWNYTIDWVHPEWEPITKVDAAWRLLYMFALEILSFVHSQAGGKLGICTVTWSECDPKRAFLIYDEKIYQYNKTSGQVEKRPEAGDGS
jgi:hypothetical protein